MNGILADEMGLGKTIQTISMLAHLACNKVIFTYLGLIFANLSLFFVYLRVFGVLT